MNIPKTLLLLAAIFSSVACYSANTATDLSWTATWDSKERDLSSVTGESSKASFAVHPQWKRLDFFGWLGWFRSGQSNKLVGFAEIDSKLEPGKLLESIEITSKSTTPDIVFRLSLEMPNDPDGCTFQADIPTTSSFEKQVFTPADFKCWRRGERLPTDRTVSFDRVERITFLVTRSSQRAPISRTPSLSAFDLQISDITLR